MIFVWRYLGSMKSHIDLEIRNELVVGIGNISADAVDKLARLIAEHRNNRIMCIGAGRMGFAIQAFAMRLSHFGLCAYFLGDTNVPRIGADDLVLFNTSSGETGSLVYYSKVTSKAGSEMCAITSNPESTLAKIADHCILLPKLDGSVQLMKTFNEQISWIFFDLTAHKLVSLLDLRVSDIEISHSILE